MKDQGELSIVAKVFHIRVDEERCKGCELCVDACPRDLLAMSERLNAKGYLVPEIRDSGRCTGCRQCADMCPEAAIEIDREDPAAPDADEPSTGDAP
jgi:2-oxoglutarate ferredoxin oxidoreductase subunit delta